MGCGENGWGSWVANGTASGADTGAETGAAFTTGVPQFEQKGWPSGTKVPQDSQNIISPPDYAVF
jgi:hypothetical protein